MATWTEAKFWGGLRSHLRRMWRHQWVPAKLALESSRRPSQSPNPRLKWEFQCACCQTWHPRKEVEIDHKTPCGSLLGFQDIEGFVTRLLPEDPSSYQILCKCCHDTKTQAEKEQRKVDKQSKAT